MLWLLMSYPQTPGKTPKQTLEQSYASRIGRWLEPVSQMAGFDWKDNVALLGGMATKELIVSSMTTLYRPDGEPADESLESASGESTAAAALAAQSAGADSSSDKAAAPEKLLSRLATAPGWTPKKALAMLVFIMLYAPCSGTLVAIRRVTDSWKWPLVSLIFNTLLGFALAVALYRLF